MSPLAPLYGLVLAGGRSKRMHTDKAALAYAGATQLERAMALLVAHVQRAFVSVRADQNEDPLRARFARIVDRDAGLGPMAGIIAAQHEHPDAAWLVLACDLPFLDDRTVAALVAARDPQHVAVAYRSTHDGLPEPLCAIYEPSSRPALRSFIATGRNCPRKFLIQSGIELLTLPDPRALDNVNTASEYAAAAGSLGEAREVSIELHVQYFAILREQAGRSEERLTTRARTARELFGELQTRHRFTLPEDRLRVAINSEFGEWTAPLKNGDAVVFIPPVAGG
ncbi:MAG: NTP transferase domain-containing protein [Steroidobacteraceae bacterium]